MPITANGVCAGNNNGQEQEHDARKTEREREEEEQQEEQLNGSSLNSLAIDSFTLIALITSIPMHMYTHTQACTQSQSN